MWFRCPICSWLRPVYFWKKWLTVSPNTELEEKNFLSCDLDEFKSWLDAPLFWFKNFSRIRLKNDAGYPFLLNNCLKLSSLFWKRSFVEHIFLALWSKHVQQKLPFYRRIFANCAMDCCVNCWNIRGGVLEDRFWSPWPWPRRSSPWPRGLKSSKIGLSSARGQQCFLEC